MSVLGIVLYLFTVGHIYSTVYLSGTITSLTTDIHSVTVEAAAAVADSL